MSTRVQLRMNAEDQAAYDRLIELVRQRIPWQQPTEAQVLRLALHLATQLVCPHCDTTLVERVDADGQGSGEWYCPECCDKGGKCADFLICKA